MTFKTLSPLLGDFEDTFRSILEKVQDVIHLCMSNVNSANVIASDLNNEY